MFCCAAIIIEKLNFEEEVDIFGSVKEIRRCNPQFVINVKQYKCLHDMVGRYISDPNEYASTDVTYV